MTSLHEVPRETGKAQVARRPEKELNESTPGRSADQLGKKVMMGHRTRHLWLPHVSLSAESRRSDTRLVQRRDVWQVGIAVSLSITRHLMRTLLSFRRKGCAPLDLCGSFEGP